MPGYKNMVEDPNSLAPVDFESKFETSQNKWKNRIWINQTLGGDYRVSIKTSVENKETGHKKSKKSHSDVIAKRSWTFSKITGAQRYKKKSVPRLEDTIKNHLRKLVENTKSMKTEEELLNEVSNEITKQIENLNFEKEVETAIEHEK